MVITPDDVSPCPPGGQPLSRSSSRRGTVTRMRVTWMPYVLTFDRACSAESPSSRSGLDASALSASSATLDVFALDVLAGLRRRTARSLGGGEGGGNASARTPRLIEANVGRARITLPVSQQERPLEHVLELSNVARPGMREESNLRACRWRDVARA